MRRGGDPLVDHRAHPRALDQLEVDPGLALGGEVGDARRRVLRGERRGQTEAGEPRQFAIQVIYPQATWWMPSSTAPSGPRYGEGASLVGSINSICTAP